MAKPKKPSTPLTLDVLCQEYIRLQLRHAFSETKGFERLYPISDPEKVLARMQEIDRLPDPYSHQDGQEDEIRKILQQSISSNQELLRLSEETVQGALLDLLECGAEELGLEDIPERSRPAHERDLPLYQELFEVLSHPARKTYLDMWGCPVLVFARPDGRPFAIFPIKQGYEYGCGPLTHDIVRSILIGTWQYGRTRHRVARDILQERYARIIIRLREHAQEQLNQAVAITHDGSSIFIAQHVVIFAGTPLHPRATRYSASTFIPAKIVISSEKGFAKRSSKDLVEYFLTSEGIVSDVTQLLAKQTLRALFSLKDAKVLFCHESAFGTPLPAGGTVLL